MTVVFSLAIVKIVLTPIFMPIYVLLLWIFIRKPEFNTNAYIIIVNIGFMDCAYFIQSLIGGILTLADSGFNPHFAAVVSSSRAGYILAAPYLCLILALNRLLIMLNIQPTKVLSCFFRVLLLIAWLIFLPVPLLMHYTSEDIIFSVVPAGFTYWAPTEIEHIIAFFGPTVQVGAFLCYIVIVLLIIYQKTFQGTGLKVSQMELRLILQAFLITLPLSIINATGLKFSLELGTVLWFAIAWHLLATFIPVINLAVYIAFNPLVRKQMLNTFGLRKSTTKVHFLNIPTASLRSSVSQRGSLSK